jgi:hypothetical protein
LSLDKFTQGHFTRVRAAVQHAHSLATAGEWMTENTFLRGEPFTFLHHEYQQTIVDDPSFQKNIRKCSQVGVSELAARLTLALANILDSSTFIYTLPTADFAKNFVKTRVDPIIATSPALQAALNNTADNTQIKQFGSSFIYYKGTIGQSAAISVPADGLIHDEVDFSDQVVMSSYESRLTHSPWKIKYKFSTPTVGGRGISEEFENSRRFFNFAKCSWCNHWFLPDYFQHVVVPGFDGEKKEITKDKLPHIEWQDAYLLCPSCGRKPDLGPKHRAWVCENPGEAHEAAGYQIQPFDAPRIITMAQLVESSTKYDRFVDFVNFGLGLPAEDKETSFSREELERMFVQAVSEGFYTSVMGIDLGLHCHIMIGQVDAAERLFVAHREVVPLPQLFERRLELARQWRVGLTVSDSQPYADMLMRMQQKDQNLYGAVYVTSKNLAMYEVKKVEEKDLAGDGDKKAGEGEERERQVNINRNRAFDGLMDFARRGNLIFRDGDDKDVVIKHLMDMKRVKDFTAEKEISYVWQKSAKGNDHYHHTLLYLWIAAKMRGVSQSSIILPGYMRKFRVKQSV